jgi:hypothetical protein
MTVIATVLLSYPVARSARVQQQTVWPGRSTAVRT